jgi:hypothetical protein
VGGDLNFTLNRVKVWGSTARVYSQVFCFIHKLEEFGLVDVEPIKIVSTW